MRASYLFTSESVSEGHPDKVCDRISDEIVDLFFREGPKAGIDPWAIRAACETLATTNQVVIAGETRGPDIRHQRPDRERRARGDQGHRLRAGRLPLGERRHRGPAASAVGRHRAGRRRAAARQTRKRARATRASCSATPANETPELMPAPIFYAHKILRLISRSAPRRQARRCSVRTPRARSPCTTRTASRSACARSWSRTSISSRT